MAPASAPWVVFMAVILYVNAEVVLVTPGDDVTLPCRASGVTSKTVIEWTRSDLKSDDYVFFLRDKRLIESFQHDLFRGRVQLKDPDLKDGDASVILKNVTMNDTGTYECEVLGDGGKFNNSVYLQVIHPEVVSVKSGDNVTLPCRAPRVTSNTMIRWTRSDLESDGHVFFLRGKRSDETNQHRLFRGRVQLKDPDLKDGDASVILKDVTVNDTGTYRCDVSGDAARRRKRAANVQTVDLKVTPGERGADETGGGVDETGGGVDETGGGVDRGHVGVLSVGLVVLAGVGVVGLLVWSRRRNQRAAQPPPPEEDLLTTS